MRCVRHSARQPGPGTPKSPSTNSTETRVKSRPNKLTLCGDLSNLFTPAIWLIKGTFVKKVYVGGRVGSGKFVLENGSVSSKYWTRHWKVVAMLFFNWWELSPLYFGPGDFYLLPLLVYSSAPTSRISPHSMHICLDFSPVARWRVIVTQKLKPVQTIDSLSLSTSQQTP